MKKEKIIKLAEKYAEGNCSQEEQKAIEQFFAKLQGKGIQGKGLQDNLEVLQETNRVKLLTRIKTSGKSTSYNKKRRLISIGIAASLVFLIGTAMWVRFTESSPIHYTEVMTQRGERKQIALPDGTLVFLNSESSLKFPERFGKTRSVELNGEGFFKVTRNPQKPFIITSDKIRTTVLGTSFNIKAYPNQNSRVSVNSGKVQVTKNNNEDVKIFLTKNRQVIFDNNTELFSESESQSEDYIAWTKNTILLKENTLYEMKSILEQWYDVKIILEVKNIKGFSISGKYGNNTLKEVLESIKFLKGLDYEFISEKEIILKQTTK